MIKIIKKNKLKPKVYHQICDNCQVKLEFEYQDVYEGAYGLFYIKCPKCGREIAIEEFSSKQLTSQNIRFPKHFVAPGGVDIPNAQIQEWIQDCLSNAEKDEDGTFYMTASGNTVVIVLKYADTYDIYVSDKYYECAIPR